MKSDSMSFALAPKGVGQGRSSAIRVFFKKYGVGYAMILPFFLFFLVFIILPVAIALVLSFTNYNMFQAPRWVGLNNYKLLMLDDEIFLIALKNTFIFSLIVGPIGYFMSFFAAWVLNQLRWRNMFALAVYAPSITTGVAMSVVWMYFFSSDRYGLINNLLINMGIIDDPVLWTEDPNYILTVIIVVSIWMSMGTGFLVFLAGLQNVGRELYEAASIDGIRNKFQELKFITLPAMKPQLLFGAITSITGSFGVFDIAVTVAGMPSPNYAGHTIVAHLYDYAFIRFQMGYASAIATILFVITFAFGRTIMYLLTDHDRRAKR